MTYEMLLEILTQCYRRLLKVDTTLFLGAIDSQSGGSPVVFSPRLVMGAPLSFFSPISPTLSTSAIGGSFDSDSLEGATDDCLNVLEQLTVQLLRATECHPLPNSIGDSVEMMDLFIEMIKVLLDQRKEFFILKSNLHTLEAMLVRNDLLLPCDWIEINRLKTSVGFNLNRGLTYGESAAVARENKLLASELILLLKKTIVDQHHQIQLTSIIQSYNKALSTKTFQFDFKVDSFSDKLLYLKELSLQLHSAQCVLEQQSNDGPAHVIHFYDRGSTPRSAEHLDTFDSDEEDDKHHSFDKTNHGLGSGVYGVAKLDTKAIKDQVYSYESRFKIFEIRNPLRLDDMAHESEHLTELSKYLQMVCNQIKTRWIEAKKQGRLQTLPTLGVNSLIWSSSRAEEVGLFFSEQENQDILKKYAACLCEFKMLKKERRWSTESIYALLLKSVKEFFVQSNKCQPLVSMPINYVIRHLGYTGIISGYNDRFNRGLVALEPVVDGSPLLKVPVKKISIQSSSSALKLTQFVSTQQRPNTAPPALSCLK